MATGLLVVAVMACAPHPVRTSVQSPPFLPVSTGERHGAVVPAQYALKMYAPPIHPRPDDYWTPTTEDIDAVERSIRTALQNALADRRRLRMLAGPAGNSPDFENQELGAMLDSSVREIRSILEHYHEYAGQYVGIVEAGRRRIWCSYFPLSDVEGEHALSSVVDGYVVVMDGGFWYWRIECEPNTGECSGFESNGYA